LHEFSRPTGLKVEFLVKMGKGWCDADQNGLVFTYGGSYVCANFGENQSRNATVRVLTDGHTDTLTLTDRRKPIL